MSTMRSPRPLHPFPHLIAPHEASLTPEAASHLSQAQRKVLGQLADGGRVLFDIEAKRALIYSVRQGLRELAELTVRTLANLVKAGWLVVTGREGRLVHYALAGRASTA